MSVAPAVKRLHNDLTRLRKARKEGDQDHKDLRADRKELKRDVKELAKDKKAGDRAHTSFDKADAQLKKDTALQTKTLKNFDTLTQAINDRLAADTFDHDAATPGVQQDPALLQALADVTQKRDSMASMFDTKLQGDRDVKARFRDDIQRLRGEIAKDRKEIKHDKAVIKHDHAEIKHDRQVNKALRHRALEHLRPAEYKMGLKATNRVRHELGLSRVDHVIRPMNLNTVQGCAQFLLKSPNVRFWSGLSTGSDRANLERLARGEKAFVPATGGHVMPKLKMMQALAAMAKQGPIMINALTGGHHSTGSNHYSGTAVDLDLSTGNAGMIQSIAGRFGGARNFETDHIHLDF